jgi:hypothetical protein
MILGPVAVPITIRRVGADARVPHPFAFFAKEPALSAVEEVGYSDCGQRLQWNTNRRLFDPAHWTRSHALAKCRRGRLRPCKTEKGRERGRLQPCRKTPHSDQAPGTILTPPRIMQGRHRPALDKPRATAGLSPSSYLSAPRPLRGTNLPKRQETSVSS